MSGLANSLARYAIIEVRRTDGSSERLVCAYPDEHSLRDVIAGPSIIARGFASREDAQASIDNSLATTSRMQNRRRRVLDLGNTYWSRILSAAPGLGAAFEIAQATRVIRGIAQSVAAAAILTFYSKNTVLSIVRSFVGGSF